MHPQGRECKCFDEDTALLEEAAGYHLKDRLPNYDTDHDADRMLQASSHLHPRGPLTLGNDTVIRNPSYILPSTVRFQCSASWMVDDSSNMHSPPFGSFPMAHDAFGRRYFLEDDARRYLPGVLCRVNSPSIYSIEDIDIHKSQLSATPLYLTIANVDGHEIPANPSRGVQIPQWPWGTAATTVAEQQTLQCEEQTETRVTDSFTSAKSVEQHNPELNSIWEKNDAFKAIGRLVEKCQRQTKTQALILHQTPPEFRRSRQVLEQEGNRVSHPCAANSRYLGDPRSKSFKAQVRGLPDDLNCALWITNIPADADYPELFNVIHTGAVFCLHINPSDKIHSTKAAKLAFTTPKAAASFLSRTRSVEGIRIYGRRLVATYNRHGYREYRYRDLKSRVLRVSGPADLMSYHFWHQYFSHCAVIHLEAIQEVLCADPFNRRSLEFRFARIDAQAESCYEAVKRDKKCQGVFEVQYWMDPCNPGYN